MDLSYWGLMSNTCLTELGHGWFRWTSLYDNDVIMSTMASQITSVLIVYSIVCLGTDQRKHQSSASLAFVRGIHRRQVNSPHEGRVTRFDDVIMRQLYNNEHHWVKQFKEDTHFTVSLIHNSIAHMLIFSSTFNNIQWVCLCIIFFIFSIWK